MVKQAIAKYVDENGIKQIYISQKTGIPAQSVSSMLRGERNLDIEEYAKLCDALNVPYNFFLEKVQTENSRPEGRLRINL